MTRILAFLPTFSPNDEAGESHGRPYTRLSSEQIATRINELGAKTRERPWLYMDSIDSFINSRPDADLVVGDARSTESVRTHLATHHKIAGGYQLAFYPERMSQWAVFNDILARHARDDTEYFVYLSSDIITPMDWVGEAIKAFTADPTLQILFPLVNSGDPNLPCQIGPVPRDEEPFEPPYQEAARAKVLNMYAAVFRMDFLRGYGGYPDLWLNCFTESFLDFLCEAMGGRMCVLPRAWLFHHNAGDSWTGDGGPYNYLVEKPLFDKVMDVVQMAREKKFMTPQFLRSILWRS